MHDAMRGRGHGRHGERGDHHPDGSGLGHGRHGRGGGGRVFGPGDLRLVLLALLAEQPRHGYELIKAIEAIFHGTYSPSPGSVYPILTMAEELGHIAPVEGDGARRPLAVTPEGRQWLAENADAVELAQSRMQFAARAMVKRTVPEPVMQSMEKLKAALAFHADQWTAAETARVKAILEQAVKEIGGLPETAAP